MPQQQSSPLPTRTATITVSIDSISNGADNIDVTSTTSTATLSASELREKRVAALETIRRNNENANRNRLTPNSEELASKPLTKKQIEDLRPLCRYFLMGSCKFGDECTHRHDVRREGGIEAARKTMICEYARNGRCRHKERCFFSHEIPCATNASTDTAPVVNSDVARDSDRSGPETESSIVQKSETESNQVEEEDSPTCTNEDAVLPNEMQENQKCGICLGNIIARGKRFGLLSNCQHCFCIDCIRIWHERPQGHSSDRNRVLTKHNCPICRQQSEFILPSKYYIRGEEKAKRIEQFKTERKDIPCNFFQKGKIGTCPFGPECIFAHLDEDGVTDIKHRDVKKGRGQSHAPVAAALRQGRGQSRASPVTNSQHGQGQSHASPSMNVQQSEEEEYISSFLDSLERARHFRGEGGSDVTSSTSAPVPITVSSLLGDDVASSNSSAGYGLGSSFFAPSNAGFGIASIMSQHDNLLQNNYRQQQQHRIISTEDCIQVDRSNSNFSMFGLDSSHMDTHSSPSVEEEMTLPASNFFDFMENNAHGNRPAHISLFSSPVPPASLFSQEVTKVDNNPFENTRTNVLHSNPWEASATTSTFCRETSQQVQAKRGGEEAAITTSSFTYLGNDLSVRDDGDDRPHLLPPSFRNALQEELKNQEQERMARS